MLFTKVLNPKCIFFVIPLTLASLGGCQEAPSHLSQKMGSIEAQSRSPKFNLSDYFELDEEEPVDVQLSWPKGVPQNYESLRFFESTDGGLNFEELDENSISLGLDFVGVLKLPDTHSKEGQLIILRVIQYQKDRLQKFFDFGIKIKKSHSNAQGGVNRVLRLELN